MRDIKVGDVYETNTGFRWEVLDVSNGICNEMHIKVKLQGVDYTPNGLHHPFWISSESYMFQDRVIEGPENE
jgi:hypothetical protein